MREESAFTDKPTLSGATGPIVDKRPHGAVRHIAALDGWRATSILLVLGSHLVPLGPHQLELNFAAGAAGMALFFTLSGFLITQFLAAGMPVPDFLTRRFARIIPLAWLAIIALLLWQPEEASRAFRNFLFIANLPPAALFDHGEHLWSLCVEMQFYASIALICTLFGRRGLYLIPIIGLCVTGARIIATQPISIVTWHRIDEILAGGIISLIYSGWFGERPTRFLVKLPMWPLVLALMVCSHPASGPLQYLRPYAAAFLVGASLNDSQTKLRKLLVSKPMAYIAEISYALYVIHGILAGTWLGTGDKLNKYAKRPLLFGITFLLAHLSTRYWEQPITRAVRERLRRRNNQTNCNDQLSSARQSASS